MPTLLPNRSVMGGAEKAPTMDPTVYREKILRRTKPSDQPVGPTDDGT
jgi:hypothetical protein